MAASSQLVPAKVAALVEGVMTAMQITKLKTAAVVLLVLTAIGVGGGLLSRSTKAAAQAPALGEQEKRHEVKAPAAKYKSLFGKTLGVMSEHFEESGMKRHRATVPTLQRSVLVLSLGLFFPFYFSFRCHYRRILRLHHSHGLELVTFHLFLHQSLPRPRHHEVELTVKLP
jgi:hypothetical protein